VQLPAGELLLEQRQNGLLTLQAVFPLEKLADYMYFKMTVFTPHIDDGIGAEFCNFSGYFIFVHLRYPASDAAC